MQFTNKSLFFPEPKIIYLDRVDSTNSFAKKIISKSAPITEGTVIVAEEQTAGRGQQGAKWVSEPGKNLTFSIIVCPSFLDISQQFALNKVVSLSLYQLINIQLDIPCKIKWPNDLVCEAGKLGGVLIENQIGGDKKLKYSVLGIGLNINQKQFTVEAGRASSLYQLCGKEYDKLGIMNRFLEIFAINYDRLKKLESTIFDQEYLQALDGYKETRNYETSEGKFLANILEIGAQGELGLDINGSVQYFWFKELKRI